MGDFFAMGGYGAYVWTAYGVTALGLMLLLIWAWIGARARDAELDQVRQWARMERQAPRDAGLQSRATEPEAAATDHANPGTAPMQASGGASE